MSRRSEVVAVEDWRARFERRAAAGRRGRASSGKQEEAARVLVSRLPSGSRKQSVSA